MNEQTPASFGDAYALWVAALVPNLLGAALLLLFGWLLAWALRKLILRLGTGLDHLFESLRLRAGSEGPGLRWPVSRIVAVTAYWLVLLFFVAVAADVLGLPGVAELFGTVLAYLPTLLLSAAALFVIVVLSGAVAGIVERHARAAGVGNAAGLGRLVRIALIAIASIMALGQIGIDTVLLVNVFTLITAAFVAGAALAFGLGAAGAVRNVIAAHHARRTYRVGQRVRVAGEEGEILEMTSAAVVLETDAGRTLVPARVFEENASVLLDADGADA